jgi:hypothetical protein
MVIRGDTVVTRSTRPLAATVDDELVMLDPGVGSYYGLDATGRAVWEHLAEPCSVAQLCRVLAGEFDVELERCAAEVAAFLGELHEAGLVEVVGG